MKHVIHNSNHVATICKTHPASDGHRSDSPWLIAYNDGKTRRFDSYASAKDEAQKVFPNCKFSNK